MEAVCKANYTRIQLPLIHRNPKPPCSPPFTSLSFRTSPPPYSPSSIKASSSNPPLPKLQNPNQFPSPLIKTTLIAAVTATAVFLTRFNLKPVIAAPIYPPATVETDAEEEISEQEEVEEYLTSNPKSIEALKVLVELRVRNRQIKEAIPVIEQLISLNPNDVEFPLAKAYMHLFAKEHKLAKLGFEQVLSKDPLCVKAYHGLVIVASESDSSSEMKQIEKLIVEGIEKCKKAKKKDELREFKLLLAQVLVIEGVYDGALKIYEEVLKEEARDFRPYLCQGIIYTLLSKREEADKCFSKYRRLVPKGHPYANYFDNNMLEKLFSRKFDLNTRAMVEEQLVEDNKDSLKVEDERDSLKTEEEMVEDKRDSKKIEEEREVEDERGDSKNEEEKVENEKASTEEQVVRAE